MKNRKYIWQDTARLKNGFASFQLDLRKVGGGRTFYETMKEAEKVLNKFLDLNKKALQESDTWTIKDLLGSFPKNDAKSQNLFTNVEWDECIKNNKPKRNFLFDEYKRMKKGSPLPQYFIEHEAAFDAILKIDIGSKLVGDFLVNDLTAEHCKTFIIPTLQNSGKKGKRSYKTIIGFRSRFNKLMQHAKVCGCIRENPMAGIKIDRPVDEDLETKAKEKLSTDFIHEIEVALPKAITLVFKFACSTGLRAGELRALTWDDIDFKTFEVSVNKSAKVMVKGGVGRVKTRTSNRLVPIPPYVVRELKELHMKKGRPAGTDLVFGTKHNTMVTKTYWREHLQATVKKITDKHLVWHDLRHYYASKMLEFYGNDVWTVSNLMGHSEVSITQKTYGHWLVDKSKKEKLRNDIAQINF